MRQTKNPQRVTQLNLFHPNSRTQLWSSLPMEVREQTLRLMTRLLRQHHRRLHAGLVEREV
jgi:hypothetical protein